MNTTTITRNSTVAPIGTLKMRGENFIVMKEEYLNELLILMKSVTFGEKLLKEGKTRSFKDFLSSLSKRRK